MKDTRQWISSEYHLPNDRQKIYFFSFDEGMFFGQYFYKKDPPSGCVSSHIFTNNFITLGEKQVSYWMPYDHTLRDMIPLPPDYMVDTSNFRSIINQGTGSLCEEIQIPDEYRQLEFTYTISGEI